MRHNMESSRSMPVILLSLLAFPPLVAQPATTPPVEMTDSISVLENEQAELALNLAHSLAKEKRYGEALQAYQEFLRTFPLHARAREARENVARIYEKRQRYELAIRQYDALYRELGTSQLGLLYRLEAARLYELTGDDNAAAAIYRELNQLDPGSDAAAKARSRLEALNLLQKATNPESSPALSPPPPPSALQPTASSVFP